MATKSRKHKALRVYEPGRNECAYCRTDLGTSARIRCAVCGPPDFTLCVDCFAAGAELRGHQNSHAYRVIDSARDPLLVEGWRAEEELLLLEAMQLYGFGDWVSVAEHVGGDHTWQECEAHYRKYYLNSPVYPLPDLTKPPDKAEDAVAAPAPAESAGDGPKWLSLIHI